MPSVAPLGCSQDLMWGGAGVTMCQYIQDMLTIFLSRPIVVTFEEFRDRDEVLRKAGLVKGGQVHVTEDMSRKVNNKQIFLGRSFFVSYIVVFSGEGEQTGAEEIHERCSAL